MFVRGMLILLSFAGLLWFLHFMDMVEEREAADRCIRYNQHVWLKRDKVCVPGFRFN